MMIAPFGNYISLLTNSHILEFGKYGYRFNNQFVPISLKYIPLFLPIEGRFPTIIANRPL